MRISTSYIQQQSVDTMLAQQKALADTQLKVSTGERFQSPSEDPIAAVKVLGYEREINLNEQYVANSEVAENKITIAEQTLGSAASLIQRIRELAIQGLNDTNDINARTGIAAEIDELNQSLLNLANTKDANGEYLFAGYQSFTQPFDAAFTYQGDSGQRNIRIGSQYMLEVTEPGDQLFVITNTNGGPTQSIFQTIQEFSNALKANTVGTAPNDGEFLTNTTEMIDTIGQARTRFGAKLNAIDQQRTINDDSTASLQTSLAKLKDLDYAEAISLLNAQTTGLQAAQQAYVKVQGLSLFNYL